jgi:small-conductance mechanosensitive channel
MPSRSKALAAALLGLAIMILDFAGPPAAFAQASPAVPPPPQVSELLKLLEDPTVRGWIDQQRRAPPPPAAMETQKTASERLAARIAEAREHLASLVAAVPRLPQEARRAFHVLSQELQNRGPLAVIILVLGFLALGGGTEWVFGKMTRPTRARILSLPMNSVAERLRAISVRAAFGLGHVAIFAIGSIGAFLVFDWPPLLKQIVLAYLIAALTLRLALLGGRLLLAPRPAGEHDADRYRVIPMIIGAAQYWHWRIALFVGWFAFGWATVSLVRTLEFSPEARELVAYALGLGLLAVALEATWTWSPAAASWEPQPLVHHRALGKWLISTYFVLLWALWVAGLMDLFWLTLAAFMLPQAIAVTRLASRHLLRPAHGPEASFDHSLTVVYLDRGLRAALIVGTAFLLAYAWRIDLVELASRDTLLTRLVRGVLGSIVILLVADLIWQVVKTQIDRRLAQAQSSGPAGSEEALKQARLRTLLPIFRNVAFVVLATVAVLMALSALGIEIGPLIAGAGIVGVAVGFGSQTLVRDIIGGIFYLLDDAFRVGEYIQSGNYKGTVEALGFRSVKLRHHRGYLYTVPFGQLGAVENMSRDWVIDKMTLNVTYDTDLELAKKIIKQIGKELAQDTAFAHLIIEPLKMQGVEQFGDYAIQIRMKMMTRPGEQFVIRRQAYALIKKAFDENGVRFAFPTVQVAGRDNAEPAAARQALTLIKGQPPTGGS